MVNLIWVLLACSTFHPNDMKSEASSMVRSPLMQEVERKKALYYYNTRPLHPPLERRSSFGKKLQGQTPAQDKLFIKPYKFPFWGLPYGIYSKGGFFNPGLFPFVPGGPGFPPYDGVFGGPKGPGQPGPPPPAPAPAPAPDPTTTTVAPPSTPTYYYPTGDESYEYYFVKRRPKKKKKPVTKRTTTTTPYPEHEEYDPEVTDGDEDSDQYYYQYAPPKPSPRPYRRRPYRVPKKTYEDTQAPMSSKKPCRYGYRSGPRGGCKGPPPTRPPKPPTTTEEPYCGNGYAYKGKCYRRKPTEPPPSYVEYEDDDAQSGDSDGYPAVGTDDEKDAEMTQIAPQYIPVYLPYPLHPGYYPDQPATGATLNYEEVSQQNYVTTTESYHIAPTEATTTTESYNKDNKYKETLLQLASEIKSQRNLPVFQVQIAPIKSEPKYSSQSASYQVPAGEASQKVPYHRSHSASPQSLPYETSDSLTYPQSNSPSKILEYVPISQTNQYGAEIVPQQNIISYTAQPAMISETFAIGPGETPISIKYTPSYGQQQTDLATIASENSYLYSSDDMPFDIVYKAPGSTRSSGSLYNPQFQRQHKSDRNLRDNNSDDFIANHLNNYTASSLQMNSNKRNSTTSNSNKAPKTVVPSSTVSKS